MGIKLIAEILDHYHGPDHKFRWLIAFAEKASDRTRTGWPGRDVMATRTGKSASRVSHVAAELISDGVLERLGGGGRNRGRVRYALLPLAAQGAPRTHPEVTSQGAPRTHPKPEVKGARATHSQGAPTAHPVAKDTDIFNPHTTLTPPGGAASAPTAQQVLGDFIDWDRGNGGTLTRQTIGQLAKRIDCLLREGIDHRHIRNGLAKWRAKEMHPSTLDSFVSAEMNGHAANHRKRPSTGDRALAEAEDLKAELRNRRELA